VKSIHVIVPDLNRKSKLCGGLIAVIRHCYTIAGNLEKRMSFRRMLPFLLLNVLVSLAVVLAMLWWWDRREPETAVVEATVAAAIADNTVVNAPALPTVALQPDANAAANAADRPGVHVVQAGETLGAISLEYDVPVDAIMAANGMENANFLAVGQELVIPEPGAAVPTAEAEVEATAVAGSTDALPTPIPTEPAATGEAALAIARVISAGQLGVEAIEIVNNGSSEAALQNWTLSDQDGNSFSFGQITLYGDGAGITLHTAAGQDSATDIFWGRDAAVWQSGETVVLADATGTPQAEFQVP
jgi:LysM repeat protein